MSDHVVVERDGAVATVVLNRPAQHNAINAAMYRDLPGIVAGLDADPEVRVLVLRGAGTRAFASGADISEFEAERSDAVRAKAYNEKVAAAEQAIEGCTKPTVAMIHGYCIGGGAGLALSCDIRFADTAASFAITPAKLGLVYSLESTRRMVDLVGPSRAKWVLMGGLRIPAARAAELGLFDEVVPTEELAATTYDFAGTVCTRAQFSVRAAKVMVNRISAGQTVDDDESVRLRNSSFGTEDFAEGVRAFLEKRPPDFRWS
ncbi:enoyl-CoA hydratase-related protein [Pseudonocardia sp. HH130630-07]|uniref:enoyl-CoA hydratase-related protein n=1 Tax=Pseudonocardia sp. HH130630-07 TaxID=1690815 RepID=UPI000814E344|nr:enoyl-CoA hydratase-related protein [Pseudonocardia sp. HH130630-07]ANY10009.1 enoyl-CoA hydratase [Pseudonocardia sp. HH130630-07]